MTLAGNVKINASGYWSISLQISGYPDQAKKITKNQLSLVHKHENPFDLFHIYALAGWYGLEARKWEDSVRVLREYLPLAREFGDVFFVLVTECHYYFAKAFLGERAALNKAIELFQIGINAGSTSFYGCYPAYIGELYYRFGEHESCLQMTDRTLHHVNRTGSHLHTPELYRIKGLALQALGEPDILVEENLNQALEQARKQSAKTFELRAARDLAKLWRRQGRGKAAHDLLRGVYDRFTEGFNSVDLQEARTLLTELETGDLRAN